VPVKKRSGDGGPHYNPQQTYGGEYQPPPRKQDLNKIFQDYLKRTKKVGTVEVKDGPFG